MRRRIGQRGLAVWQVVVAAGPLALGLAQTGRPTEKVAYGDVAKLLRAKCVSCHGGDAPAAGLDLRTYETLMKGGASGPPVIKGQSAKSLLLQRVKGVGGPQMPLGFTPLSARELKLVADWIDQGATSTGEPAKHWAYVPPVRPPLPLVRDKRWVRNPVDRFVLARLEKEGLRPSPEADRATLLRRVTLDLTGLPPTLAEMDAFLADKSPDAYEKVVDRLLASPHYGEEMALPWLDAARYADSNGFQMEGDTYQWVWRDWVVRAMNAGMPYDRFATEQLAGDLMPGAGETTPEGRDLLVATGFNRNHMLNEEGGAIEEEQRNIVLFDRVDTTATVFSGLTMGCARCHDHKYDPFTQRDYYSLMAYFNNVPERGRPEGGVPYSLAKPWIYAGSPEQMARLTKLTAESSAADQAAKKVEDDPETARRLADWERAGDTKAPKAVQDALAAKDKSKDQEATLRTYFLDNVLRPPERATAKRLREELAAVRAATPKPMVMSDAQPRETHVLNRGNYTEPREKVGPGVPALFGATGLPKNRLGLAAWVVSPQNPLTARVAVNRYWQTFFGRGLVKTSENFGVQGEPPSHPALLDWLATEFVRSGWDVKGMHRLIVTSATYRQSSRVSPALLKRDPENVLLARGARFRMPSLVLRDVALAASGLANLKVGGAPVYPYQPKGIWSSLAITDERDFTYPQSHGADLYRRSIYTFWRRTVAPGNMFDASARQVCVVRSYRTSTPLHALTMLNDVTWVEAGRALAQRVMLAKASRPERLGLAFRLVCGRTPSPSEMAVLSSSVDKALSAFRKDEAAASRYLAVGESPRDRSLGVPEHAAYAAVCLSILNLDEAMTRE
ncbi:MAG: DUF1553 domain-containing protein [Fimbriimonadaceae bacterium]|nr:DUF1553 domain-containing protein [Fimbriimonadaceae bacterium]